jgi:hypothetical protein
MKRSVSASVGDQFSKRLSNLLNMYSIAAGAAGVGLLALAQPANGEIVYTPADVVLSGRFNSQTYALDLNHDGIADFVLSATWHRSARESGGFSRISVRPTGGNGAIGYHGNASALAGGQPIDGRHKFAGKLMAWMDTYFGSDFGSGGKWTGVVDDYLGFAFKINGQIHYGWARLTVSSYDVPLKAALTGYAYETEVKKPIFAGQTSDTDQQADSTPYVTVSKRALRPALGLLALGSSSLSAWRRRDQAMEESAD